MTGEREGPRRQTEGEGDAAARLTSQTILSLCGCCRHDAADWLSEISEAALDGDADAAEFLGNVADHFIRVQQAVRS